jgi:hypothetical protein
MSLAWLGWAVFSALPLFARISPTAGITKGDLHVAAQQVVDRDVGIRKSFAVRVDLPRLFHPFLALYG